MQESSSVQPPQTTTRLANHEKTDSKVLDLIGGRRALRDRSVDSTKSNGSGKRVAFAEKGTTTTAASATPPKDLSAPTATTNVGNAAVDTMRSLGNTLNPLNRFSNMAPSFRGFGRSSPVPATPSAEKSKQLGHGAEAVSLSNANNNNKTQPVSPPPSAEMDLNAVEAIAELRKTAPPVKRFVECNDARELRVGDVEELLRDYQRLVGVVRQAMSA
ncbi:hypothetical protein LTR16_003142 [Cryomyces antarcticus]|uniref:Uncharacterized protein n=1 Tax=Cryomyces antarcticus TaxID=329879 RepID=A0ABR0KSS8_9PEZI|nr:hypothetical protein LTR16_003142 [Cryomyces antarcticus]